MIRELLAVGCGGAAGRIVRYLLSGGIMAAYVGLSVAVCIVFAAAGMWIGTTFRN